MIDVLIIDDDPIELRKSLISAQEQNEPFRHQEARLLGENALHSIDLFIERITIASERNGEYDDGPAWTVYVAIGSVAIDGSDERLPALLKIHSHTDELTPAGELEVSNNEY